MRAGMYKRYIQENKWKRSDMAARARETQTRQLLLHNMCRGQMAVNYVLRAFYTASLLLHTEVENEAGVSSKKKKKCLATFSHFNPAIPGLVRTPAPKKKKIFFLFSMQQDEQLERSNLG